MNTITRIQQGFDQKVERIIDALQRMSARERYMVIFASILVVVALVGFHFGKCTVWPISNKSESMSLKI
jgi:general secretion pathway protein M